MLDAAGELADARLELLGHHALKPAPASPAPRPIDVRGKAPLSGVITSCTTVTITASWWNVNAFFGPLPRFRGVNALHLADERGVQLTTGKTPDSGSRID